VPAAVLAQNRSAPTRQVKPASNYESKSAELATELAKLFEEQKISNLAAPLSDSYVGALYMPGVQLLVVTGKFSTPDRMNYLIAQKSFREAYQDLNSASERGSRLLISDLGADGLRFKREKDEPFDFVDIGGKSVSFDGEWGGKTGVSREEYAETYVSTDERYAEALQALLDALKKPS
jgi:hypothetical protein